MDSLNKLLTSVGDLLLAPFRNHPATGLVCWSVVTGVVMTYVFGKTSNQRALRRAADGIRAQLFAVKLFKEDLFVTFRCQIALLKFTGMRLLHSLAPMLVMSIPLLLVMTQLAMRYEYRPLLAGERAVVAMHVKPDRWKEVRNITLSPGDRFVVETQSLRDERNSTIFWRVRADGSESDRLRWQLSGDSPDVNSIVKELPIGATEEALVTANRTRPGARFWDRLLYPAESGISAASPVSSIDVHLRARDTPILGWNIPWWATFFLVAMITALIAGKFLGVQY
jgi:hypothetical protein